jgi:hypothetical protein
MFKGEEVGPSEVRSDNQAKFGMEIDEGYLDPV